MIKLFVYFNIIIVCKFTHWQYGNFQKFQRNQNDIDKKFLNDQTHIISNQVILAHLTYFVLAWIIQDEKQKKKKFSACFSYLKMLNICI